MNEGKIIMPDWVKKNPAKKTFREYFSELNEKFMDRTDKFFPDPNRANTIFSTSRSTNLWRYSRTNTKSLSL